MVEPGSADPRGASPPFCLASLATACARRPLADRPGPEGVTLQVPGRSTMDRAYGAEASTDHRWIRASARRLRHDRGDAGAHEVAAADQDERCDRGDERQHGTDEQDRVEAVDEAAQARSA